MKKDKIIKIALLSLIVNLTYGIYNVTVGFVSESWWLITTGVYFMILGILRVYVLKTKKKSQKVVGWSLVGLSWCFAGTVILAVVRDRGVKYNQIVMITIALYTFTKVVLAIINLVKMRKGSFYSIRSLRNISFCDAFVSMFALQRSMLVSFPGMNESEIRLFNILTGSAVCILILLVGLNLIEGRMIKMAKSKIVKANEKSLKK